MHNEQPRIGTRHGIVVFSGGSAANSLVDVFNDIAEKHTKTLSYVIPISDNGGSTSELIRVLGGPGIGDLRSRLVRLIPDSSDPGSEAHAIRMLFNHRLADTCDLARREWLDIVEVQHSIWDNISSPKKELIRSFLITVNLEIAKRLRPSSRFDFSKASIGNLFLTGARIFIGSLESAIYLLSAICNVPSTISVLPALNTTFPHHISAVLENGHVITGQNNISHPSLDVDSNPSDQDDSHKVEDANLPGTLPSLRTSQISFTKSPRILPLPPTDTSTTSSTFQIPPPQLLPTDDLPSRISKIHYISPYGAPISHDANPRVINALTSSSAVIYSIGSLFTSIVPSLILRGVGAAITCSPSIKFKILILNGSIDRETGPSSHPFTAVDFVNAIVNAGEQSTSLSSPPRDNIVRKGLWKKYVTHLIYLDCDAAPRVERDVLASAGIEAIKALGKLNNEGEMRYDPDGLRDVLGMILGRSAGVMGERSRRNTMEK